MNQRLAYTRAEVDRLLKLREGSAARLVRQGLLVACEIKVGGRAVVRVTADSVRAYLARASAKPPPARGTRRKYVYFPD
jgi:hypothetical protein